MFKYFDVASTLEVETIAHHHTFHLWYELSQKQKILKINLNKYKKEN